MPLSSGVKELAELRQRLEELRHEHEAVLSELAMRRREMALLAELTSQVLSDGADETRLLEQRYSVARLCLDIAVASTQGETGDALLSRLLRAILEAIKVEAAAVFAAREMDLKLVAAQGLQAGAFVPMAALEFSPRFPGLLSQFREPVVITPSVAAQFVMLSTPPQAFFKKVVAIPLLAEKELVGVLALANVWPQTVALPELQPITDLGTFVRSALIPWHRGEQPPPFPAGRPA